MKTLLIHLCAIIVCSSGVAATTMVHPVPDTSLAKRKTVFRSGVVKYVLLYGSAIKWGSDTVESIPKLEFTFDEYGTKIVSSYIINGDTSVSLITDSGHYEYRNNEGQYDNRNYDSINTRPLSQKRSVCIRVKNIPETPKQFKSFGYDIDNLVDVFSDGAYDYRKQNMVITRVQDSILLGKRCTGYRIAVREKRGRHRVVKPVLQVWCWDKIPMCIRTASGYVNPRLSEPAQYGGVILVATSIEVNNPVPAERFLLLEGRTIIDLEIERAFK